MQKPIRDRSHHPTEVYDWAKEEPDLPIDGEGVVNAVHRVLGSGRDVIAEGRAAVRRSRMKAAQEGPKLSQAERDVLVTKELEWLEDLRQSASRVDLGLGALNDQGYKVYKWDPEEAKGANTAIARGKDNKNEYLTHIIGNANTLVGITTDGITRTMRILPWGIHRYDSDGRENETPTSNIASKAFGEIDVTAKSVTVGAAEMQDDTAEDKAFTVAFEKDGGMSVEDHDTPGGSFVLEYTAFMDKEGKSGPLSTLGNLLIEHPVLWEEPSLQTAS